MKTTQHPYWFDGQPVAYPASDIGKKLKFAPEPFDDLVPEDGFISDFVLGSRNIAAPTLFGVWTGIFAVSSVLKRNAFFRWADTILVPNVYMILVAPPGVVKKSTQLNKFLRVIKESGDHIKDPVMGFVRMPKTRKGAITPEALHEELLPEFRILNDPKTGKRVRYSTGSTLNLVVSELTTLIDKKKYNIGLIDKLTSLFDSSDIGEDKTTKSEGVQSLQDIYVTLAGATTPESMKSSFPEEALGGGFMSRAIMVYAQSPTRVYDMPPEFEEIPDNSELGRRLAWIIDNARGEYRLTEDARNAHRNWYRSWVADFVTMPEREQNLYARYDILVLKLALILRCQRYVRGTDVTLDDYLAAHRLLEATMGRMKNLLGYIQGNVDTDREDEILRRVESKNKKDLAGLSRKNLQGYVRSIYKGQDFKFAIRDLFSRRELCSFDHGELRYDRPKERADELYYVIPPEIAESHEIETQLLSYIAKLTRDPSLSYAIDPLSYEEPDEELELEPEIRQVSG